MDKPAWSGAPLWRLPQVECRCQPSCMVHLASGSVRYVLGAGEVRTCARASKIREVCGEVAPAELWCEAKGCWKPWRWST